MLELTKAQQSAVTTTDRSLAVVAHAGSGKTRVLTERFRNLIWDLEIPLYNILAFTFTEKAAGEIKSRILKDNIIKPEEEGYLSIGTIHSFMARLLRQFGSLIELDPSFDIVGETDAFIEKEELVKKYLKEGLQKGDPLIVALIQRFGFGKFITLFSKLLLEAPLLGAERSIEVNSDTEASELIRRAVILYRHWTENKKTKACLHFDDLENLGLALLKDNPSIRHQLTKRYKHLLVDEFQDTSPIQGEIIRALFEPGVNTLFIVGDPKQSIYRFRRADVAIFQNIIKQIEEYKGEMIQLNETFRLAPRLTEAINKVFSPLFESFSPMIPYFKERQGHLKLIIVSKNIGAADAQRKVEAQWIANHLVSLNLSSEELQNTALLFRSGNAMPLYREELLKKGIPCEVTRTTNLFSHQEIKDLMHLLSYFSGSINPIVMTGILRSKFFQFSETFIDFYQRQSPPHFLAPFTPDLFTSQWDQKEWSRLTLFIRRWSEIKDLLLPSLFFQIILKDLGFESWSEAQRLLICQWQWIIEEWESQEIKNNSLKTDLLSKLFQALKALSQSFGGLNTLQTNKHSGAVRLMTIHAAKGLEFKRVFLPQLYATTRGEAQDFIIRPGAGIVFKKAQTEFIRGLKIELEETDLFSEFKQKEETEEQREAIRLLYVAMTRASEELTLFLREPSNKKIEIQKTDNWNEWLWTLLKEEREQGLHLTAIEESTKDLSLQKNAPLAPTLKSPPQIEKLTSPKPSYTVSAIETYLNCPKAYELKHIAGIQPLLKKTHSLEKRYPQNLTAQQWGLLTHEVFQFLNFNNLANQQTVIEQALTNQHFSDDSGEIRQRIEVLIHQLKSQPLTWNILSNSTRPFVELPFFMDCGPFYLRGTLDRLFQYEGEWFVLDYKTDHLNNASELEERIKAYQGQMACYALAASSFLNLPIIKTALLFLSGPHLHIQHWLPQDLDKIRSSLHEIHASLTQQKRTFTYTEKKETCFHCSYFDLNYCGVKNLNKI